MCRLAGICSEKPRAALRVFTYIVPKVAKSFQEDQKILSRSRFLHSSPRFPLRFKGLWLSNFGDLGNFGIPAKCLISPLPLFLRVFKGFVRSALIRVDPR